MKKEEKKQIHEFNLTTRIHIRTHAHRLFVRKNGKRTENSRDNYLFHCNLECKVYLDVIPYKTSMKNAYSIVNLSLITKAGRWRERQAVTFGKQVVT